MVRIARGRIDDLFGLAGQEAARGEYPLADRYVRLAREIGTRYNVRLRPQYRELYCRDCSVYWVEGRTVRTRLRVGHRVRTCLRCGGRRRTRTGTRPTPPGRMPPGAPSPAGATDEALAELPRSRPTPSPDERPETEP